MPTGERKSDYGSFEAFGDDLVGHIDVVAKFFAEYLNGRGKIL